MGWFDGLFGQSESTRSSDPLAKLDPKLRAFLEQESPLKLQQAEEKQKKQQQQQQQEEEARNRAPPIRAEAAEAPSAASGAAAGAVPAASLYPDGRYSDLWKTYRPLSDIEADTKSDHERLMDVLDAYKERRAQIGRAALENCALEQIDWNECIKSGPLSKRMTMCHAEMKKFERCYNMQSRLLKALGYLSAYDRSPEVDERIQVHADTLFHRMLAQEAAAEQAKAEGRPAPPLDLASVLALSEPPRERSSNGGDSKTASPSGPPATPGLAHPDIAPDLRKQWDEKLAKLPEADRAAEEAAMRAELQARAELAGRVTELRAAQAAAREQRRAEGKATLKDRVSGLFGH